jgi:hypothetical protein
MLAQSLDGPGEGAASVAAANPIAAQATIQMMPRFMIYNSFVVYLQRK